MTTTAHLFKSLKDICHHAEPTKLASCAYCLGLSLCFVLSLYLFVPPSVRTLSRNNVKQIKWRSFAVIFFSVIAISSYPFCSSPTTTYEKYDVNSTKTYQYLGLSWRTSRDCFVLLHTMSLFLGPLIALLFKHYVNTNKKITSESHSRNHQKANGLFSIQGLKHYFCWENARNYVIAPLSEEMVFRGCMSSPLLASGYTIGQVSFLAPLFFGTAHAHHAILKLRSGDYGVRLVVLSTLMQFAYTSLFGSYATYAFLHTGSVFAVILSHAFCNIMGLPDLGFLSKKNPWGNNGLACVYPFRHFILFSYLVGIGLFTAGFFGDRIFHHEDGLVLFLSRDSASN